jgi:hypothetical protein
MLTTPQHLPASRHRCGYPGLHTSVRTYAEDRVAAAQDKIGDELVVRVYGADLSTLRDTASDVASMLSTVPGVLTPRVEPQVTEPSLQVEVDLAAAQRVGLRPGDVRREATTLISGLAVGNLYQEQKVFDVVVWGGPAIRQSLSDLEALRIDTPSGGQVRLGDVAKVRIAPDPAAIDHNSVSRSLDVTAVVNGRSPADVGQEVTSRLRGTSFPYEYHAEVLGDAAQRQSDHLRVAAIAAVVALLSFLILQAATGSWGLAAALLVTLPVAVAGGVLVAPLVGGVRSIGVLVALFALLALAIRQALVFVRRARQLGDDPGASPGDAVQRASRELAPSVIGVALVMAAILIAPAVMGTTAGLEVFHPFAVSMLVGLITATAVSLIASAFYLAIANRALLKEGRGATATYRHLKLGEFRNYVVWRIRRGSCGDPPGRQWLCEAGASTKTPRRRSRSGWRRRRSTGASRSASARSNARPSHRTGPSADQSGQGEEVISYSAVIYDADGKPWAYSAPSPRTYIRVPIVISSIAGNAVQLKSGPPVGTQVVVVGVPELVGAEAGISGEE